MFINCPNCNALVATDLVTDQPPPHCPRCDYGLRDAAGPPPSPPAVDAAASPGTSAPVPDPYRLLTPAPAAAPVPALPQAVPPAVRFVPLHEPPRSAALAPPPLQVPAPGPAATDVIPDRGAAAPDTDSTAPARQHDDRRDAEPAPAPATPPQRLVASRADRPTPDVTPTLRSGLPATPDAATGSEGRDPVAIPAPVPPPSPDAVANAAHPPDTPLTTAAPGDRAGAASAVRVAPSFLRGASPAGTTMSPRERHVLRIAIPALALLLLLQLLLADRVRLAADATWRPWVGTACALVRCALPPWHAPEAIALVQRDVRPHPVQHGVLQVSATLRNDAAYPQAWPMLLLTLSDVDGRPLGARWFAPEEYRPADAADTLAPGAAAAFRIDVVEPSPHTVAFNFAFG
ncbi:DUF3426 domain-containing protein [Luteimonas yindakuii]|uniref:DUF3426 domain-containing protein n=1 Tax=Luteimonas yindakuii TaxID=2565782 RepID=A0A4Z1RFQ5_9GAMM|nr:DUF3426 domain-containing protein [Luteimonas yindakuii]TKS52919.1 DUF3426 domain-containing protein [Luteimonas yindakuii]